MSWAGSSRAAAFYHRATIGDCHEGDPAGRGQRHAAETSHTPKPIVPIFNRPFLHHQIDVLKQVPEIDEVILSLNYQPRRIEEIFGDGSTADVTIRYVVEPAPLGTAGAVKYAGDSLTDSVVVFNGDVLTQIDLAAVLRLHRERRAQATIVLTPVENPAAYGVVETDSAGNVTRFLEKPAPDTITTNHINAGIYVLEPSVLGRIAPEGKVSIERATFPAMVADGTLHGVQSDSYWIDAGTQAFLKELIVKLKGSKIKLLLNYRPEYVADWLVPIMDLELALSALGEKELGVIADELLGSDASVQPVRQDIIQRAGGNPFFVEEAIRSLAEAGHLEGARGAYVMARALDKLLIPDSLQEILAARIDRLGDADNKDVAPPNFTKTACTFSSLIGPQQYNAEEYE